MKPPTTIKALIVALAFSLVGCTYVFGPVKLAQAFTDAKSQVIDEMAKAVKKSPSAAGVAEARKAFEARKADLIAKREELKKGPQGMNVDWETDLNAMEDRHRKQLDGIGTELAVACDQPCSDVTESWGKLKKDFNDSVKWNQ